MQNWDHANSTEEELIYVKCKLEIMELGNIGAELDWSIAEDVGEMLQCELDHSTSRNEGLTQKLDSAHQRIVELTASSSFGARSAIGNASLTVSRTSKGMQTYDLGIVDSQSMDPLAM